MQKLIFQIALLTTIPLVCSSQFYPAKVYTTIDGLPSNAVFDLTQGESGEMWFVTSKGVVIYDGHSWNTLPDSLDLPHNIHARILKTSDGTMWIAGRGDSSSSINYCREGQWNRIDFPENWKEDDRSFSFQVIENGSDFKLILASNRIQYFYNMNENAWVEIKKELKGRMAINSIDILNGEAFFNTYKGQYVLKNDSLYPSPMHKILGGREVLTMTERNGILYLLGFNWLGEIHNGELEIYETDIGISGKSGYKRYSLIVDSRDRIFFCAYSRPKLYNRKTRSLKILTVEGRLSAILSNKLFLDKENNIWSADNRGLFKFNVLKFENYNKEVGLGSYEVTAILETSQKEIILANNQYINILDENQNITTKRLPFPESSLQLNILDIEEDFDGKILLATQTGGLISYRSGTFKKEAPLKKVTSVERFKDKIYFTSSSSLWEWRNNRPIPVKNEKEKSPFLRNLVNIDNEKMALLSNGGFFLFDGEKFESFNASKREYMNTYASARWRNEIIVATQGGLTHLKNGELVPYHIPGLREVTFALLVDSKDNLWIGTYNGVYKWNGDQVRYYPRSQGLVGNELNRNALIEDSKGKVWIGTELGASAYIESEDVTNSTPPELKITNSPRKEIPFDKSDANFGFKAISFINNDITYYRYRLIGLDSAWRHENSRGNTTAFYPSLPDGEFTFQVQAKNEVSDWGSTVSYDFIVRTPFYRTPFFILAIALMIILFLLAMFRLRFYILIRRQEKLKKMVDAKTRDLTEANEELKKIQVQLIQTEKMAALGVLTAGIAHEINNPISFIKSGVDVIRKLSYKENGKIQIQEAELHEEVLSNIVEGVSRVRQIVKSLGSFSRSNEKNDTKCKLNAILEDCLTVLNYKLKRTITVQRNFSDNLKCVLGNEGKLYQVFTNIIANSIQAIDGEDGQIDIDTFNSGRKVIVKIKDSGAGISQENLSKIFDPFFTTKETGEGTGLGLSIVFNIIEEHKAKIDYSSLEGEGTTVSVTFDAVDC